MHAPYLLYKYQIVILWTISNGPITFNEIAIDKYVIQRGLQFLLLYCIFTSDQPITPKTLVLEITNDKSIICINTLLYYSQIY